MIFRYFVVIFTTIGIGLSLLSMASKPNNVIDNICSDMSMYQCKVYQLHEINQSLKSIAESLKKRGK
jgi:hypothetical protein